MKLKSNAMDIARVTDYEPYEVKKKEHTLCHWENREVWPAEKSGELGRTQASRLHNLMSTTIGASIRASAENGMRLA
jgi:hypothetical protein